MSDVIPESLVEAFLRLCQGEFAFRLPRNNSRDAQDTAAFFFNAIAEELERMITSSIEQEQRLAHAVESLSAVLLRVAAGDLTAKVERDYRGDSVDVLAFLIDNTVAELRILVAERERRAEEDRQKLERLVEQRTRELRESLEEQKKIEQRLRELATTDALTGMLNRRRLFEVAEEELSRSARYKRPVCIAMCDLDHFKEINDRHGHCVGDDALALIGKTLRAILRRQDHAGRYGGEEIAIVLPETKLEIARVVLERTRAAIEGLSLEAGNERVPVTASVGVVEWSPGETLSDTLRRADDALYAAKTAGRNCVVARDDAAEALPGAS